MKVVDVKNWFCRYAEVIQEKKSFLTELDSAIGDGDHGTNMARGWKEVQTQLKAFKGGLSECFLLVSRTLISHVGGASGPLYGTAFLRMSMVLKEKEHISVEDWKELLNAGCEGIGQRGGTSGGEKTMYDVWLAVTNEAQQETGDDERSLFSRLSEAARKKVEESKELKALKGRASYLGDRSIGHIDPGSESTALLFETLDQTMSQSNEEKTMRKPKTALLLVSHSEQLAEGTKELISAMARDVPVLTAAGDGVGGLGTRSEAIEQVVKSSGAEQVLLFFDIGSAQMNAEMAAELLKPEGHHVMIADAPFVEGALVAAIALQVGKDITDAVKEAEDTRKQPKKG